VIACVQPTGAKILTVDAAEEKRREFTLPGTKPIPTLQDRSSTPGSSTRFGTMEPLSAVPHYLSANSSESSRSSTPSPVPSTLADPPASTSAKTSPAARNSVSLDEFNLEDDMDWTQSNDPEDVVVFGVDDDEESSDSSDSDSESESLPEEKSKVLTSKAKRRESWDNAEPLTPKERKRIEALGSSYEKAREMNIKYRDREMAEVGLHEAAHELQLLLRPKLKLSGAARKPKNVAEPVNAGPSRRLSRLSTRM
jgi:hypothetical protein